MNHRACLRRRIAGVLAAAAAMSLPVSGLAAEAPSGPELVGRFDYFAGLPFEVVTTSKWSGDGTTVYRIFHEVRYYLVDGPGLSFSWKDPMGVPFFANVLPPAGASGRVDEFGDPVAIISMALDTRSEPQEHTGTLEYQALGVLSGLLAGPRIGQAPYYAPVPRDQVQQDVLEGLLMLDDDDEVKVRSAIAPAGPGYLYTYTIENGTDQPLDFDWSPVAGRFAAGAVLAGTVPAFDPSAPGANVLSFSALSALPAIEASSLVAFDTTLVGLGVSAAVTMPVQTLLPVPEPGAWALMGAGLLTIALARRRRA